MTTVLRDAWDDAKELKNCLVYLVLTAAALPSAVADALSERTSARRSA